jgi:hypothetical protein
MRISTDHLDPGYSVFAHRCAVRLDGAPLKHCVTADEERGEAVVYVIDPSTDKPVLDSFSRRLRTKFVRGHVQIDIEPAYLKRIDRERECLAS